MTAPRSIRGGRWSLGLRLLFHEEKALSHLKSRQRWA
jgi:hypothetical protein